MLMFFPQLTSPKTKQYSVTPMAQTSKALAEKQNRFNLMWKWLLGSWDSKFHKCLESRNISMEKENQKQKFLHFWKSSQEGTS